MNRTVLSVLGLQPAFVGGAESWCRELSSQLGEAGWRNVLCFMKTPSEAVRHYLQLPNVEFEVVENSRFLRAKPAKDLWKILRKHRPAILHLQFTGFLSVYPWMARLCGVSRIFLTAQGSQPEGFVPRRAPAWKQLAARVINQPIRQVIAVSEFKRRCLAAHNLGPATRLRTIYNSVDFVRMDRARPDGSQFRRKYSIPEDRSMVAQVGSIIAEKGVDDLLEAARQVVAVNPKIQFVLAGEGGLREHYARMASERGLGGHVTWTGVVVDPMAEGLFAAADIVCQVSRWEEAFGWTIAEAMAHGKPMVATRVGGIPELVEDGRSGYLVAPRDPAAIAEKILLLANPELRQRMGETGRRIAEAKFDLRRNVAEVLRLYGV